MKMHVAIDEVVGIATNVLYGPANEHDIVRVREIFPEDTSIVYGDAGYVGMSKRDEFSNLKKMEYMIACHPGCLKTMSADSVVLNKQYNEAVSTWHCLGMIVLYRKRVG